MSAATPPVPSPGSARVPSVKSLIVPAGAAVVVAVAAVALSQGGGGSARGPSIPVATVNAARLVIVNYAFAPATLTVKAGTTITVKNTDSTEHTATAGSGAFDSGTLKPGQSAHFALKEPGTYTYYCQFHAFMTGTIKVLG